MPLAVHALLTADLHNLCKEHRHGLGLRNVLIAIRPILGRHASKGKWDTATQAWVDKTLYPTIVLG
jgi:hypothetical protein